MIRACREALDLTQEDVALALGVSFGAVSQWETGRTHPRRAVAYKLDGLLQGAGRIFGALGYAVPKAEPTEVSVSPLDALAARMEGQALALRAVLRVVRQLASLGVDVSGLPGDDVLNPPIAQ